MGTSIGVIADLDLSRLVAIVGAGFSKHAALSMPVLAELGNELVERLHDGALSANLIPSEQVAIGRGRVPLGGVESWLTSLASGQPFHVASERMRRKALFLDVSRIVAEIVQEREREALQEPMPPWLARLVTLWHYCRSTVVTFNYDTLIEAAVETLQLTDIDAHDPSRLGRVTARDLSRSFPPSLPRPGMEFAPRDVETFELIKLHGSLNWWGRPSANDLFSIVASAAPAGWNSGVTHRSPMRGLSPVIVPPIADKSGQYTNPTIETLWLDAAEAIRQASTLMLFGYSLPLSDTTASALITENLSADTPILVVDPRHSQITKRLREWLPNRVAGVGRRDSDDKREHAAVIDELLNDFERAAVTESVPWFQGTSGGPTHMTCFVRIETADGATFDCAGWDEQVLLAGDRAVPGAFTVCPNGPPIDPIALAACKFVRTRDSHSVPIYRFDREHNTNEHSIVAVRTGPQL